MLFDHFLTPHPHPRGGLGRGRKRFLCPPAASAASAEGENIFSLRRRRRRGDLAEVAVVCLNENVLLAPFAQLGRLFCLLGLRPRRQKSRPRFAKGARILHFPSAKTLNQQMDMFLLATIFDFVVCLCTPRFLVSCCTHPWRGNSFSVVSLARCLAGNLCQSVAERKEGNEEEAYPSLSFLQVASTPDGKLVIILENIFI